MMRYIDVCSGISAPTMAWKPLGWQALCFAEIEPAPRAVLAHHYPDVPLVGDFTQIEGDEYGPVDLLVGGTPCQDFSVAGLRAGLDGERGNLTLEYLRLADRARPRWLVWENVPGVLSIDGGRAFGAILGALGELGYGWAYRVLDAQHFGVPQRRRRVFVVGYLGDWRRAAAVLFERHSLQGHSPPRREKGQNAPTIPSRSTAGGGLGTDFDCDGGLIASTGDTSHCLNAGGMGRQDYETETLIAHSLRGEGFDASEDGTGRGTPIIPIDMRQASRGATMTNNRAEGSSGGAPGTGIGEAGDPSPTVSTSHVPAVAFSITPSNSNKDYNARQVDRAQALTSSGNRPSARGGDFVMPLLEIGKGTTSRGVGPNGSGLGSDGDPMFTLQAGAQHGVGTTSAVRRLTPRECERLQGFPEAQKSYIIRVCQDLSGQQLANAVAALKCRRSQSNVWTAGAGGWTLSAEAAADHSSTSLHGQEPPVALDVLLDLERMAVATSSAGRSFSPASNAGERNEFPLPTGIESFARLAALLTHAWALAMSAGRAGSPASITPSTPHLNGSGTVLLSGREIAGRAGDAAESIALARRLSTSTTLPSGLDTQTFALMLETLSCCVVHAIAGLIPERTPAASSYDVRLTTTQGFTLVPYRKGMMADGPRYKMLGNSMAVPVVRWIGARIAMVDALCAQLDRAA